MLVTAPKAGEQLSPRTVRRPRIAFFDFPDVFEDFYPHYGLDQRRFARHWAATSSHAFLSLLQSEIGDVRWFALTLRPDEPQPIRHPLGFEVQLIRSSVGHRLLWKAFYGPRFAWRWRGAYRSFATVASYLAPVSRAVAGELRRWQPDAIFAQSYSSGRFDVLLGLSRWLHVPLVAYHTGGSPERYLSKAVRRHTLPRADLLIASSQSERAMLISRFGVRTDRVPVILTPIDTAAFRPLDRLEACRTAGLDPSARYVLFVGRLSDHEKRVGALIDAFAEASGGRDDVHLLLVGEGPDGERLRRHAASFGNNRIHFLGWMSGSESLTPLYNASDCLLLPSRREGFPTVVAEAAACGTPVLASRVGGVPEIVIEGHTGWLVEPGDDLALTERLRHVIEHPEQVREMRPDVRHVAEERVAPSVVGAQLRAAFGQVLAG